VAGRASLTRPTNCRGRQRQALLRWACDSRKFWRRTWSQRSRCPTTCV